MKFALPKLDWKVWVAIAIVVVVLVGVVAWPYLAQSSAQRGVEAEIKELQDRLQQISVTGGDPNEADAIRGRLRTLTQTANAYGSATDLGQITLTGCDAMYNRIESEWLNYTQTSYADPLKRNNTRTSILAFGQTLARCYEQSISDATDVGTLQNIRLSLLQSIARSEFRRVCFETDGPGCGRSGVSEDHGFDKAAQERDNVQAQLRNALAILDAKVRASGGPLGALA